MNRDLKMEVAGSGMTNYQVELKAGLPLTKLSRFIHGAAQPSQDEMEAIAGVLSVPVERIFKTHSTVAA